MNGTPQRLRSCILAHLRSSTRIWYLFKRSFPRHLPNSFRCLRQLDLEPLPPQHEQGHHGHDHTKRTREWDEQYGRVALSSPLTGCGPKLSDDLSAPAHPPNPISRRSSLCSQTSSSSGPTITLSTGHSRGPRSDTKTATLTSVHHSEREGAVPIAQARRVPMQSHC